MLKNKLLLFLSTILFSHLAWSADLCNSSEVAVFSCQLKENKKIVSLCSSKYLSAKTGYLQYRYGSADKIELKYPSTLTESQAGFGYDSYSRSDLSTFILGFNISNYRYEISETTEGGQDDGTTLRALLVSSIDKKHDLKLTCLDNANLTSNISTLEDVVPCDKKHEIVEGSCS